MDFYIKEFELHLLEEKKVSKNTYDGYMRDINGFLSYKSFDSIPASSDVENYEMYLEKHGKSRSTISRVNASLRCYYNFLRNKKLIDDLPDASLKIKKSSAKIPDILTSEEIEALLNAPDTSDYKGMRDKAILETFYATGIKASELISLTVSDVNIKMGYIRLKNGDKERILPMYARAVRALSEYIKYARGYIATDGCEALFLNMNGSALTRQGLWKIIKSYAEKTGIEKTITPHIIRHSFAAHLLENGAGLDDIKEIMGYSDISSTRLYSQIFKSKYTKAYKKFHPLAR